MGTIRVLSLAQLGLETTKGTAVAATARLMAAAKIAEVGDVKRPELTIGVLTENPGGDVVTRHHTEINLDIPLNFEQLMYILAMSVKGGVVGVGTAPTVWTYLASETADPVPDSYTVEGELSDGTTKYDIEVPYCLCSEFTISCALNDLAKLTAKLFGRKMAASTLTPTISVPTIETASVQACKVYIDETWAGLGGTPVSGQVFAADLTYKSGLTPEFRMDGRTDLDFSKYGFGRHGASLKATLEFAASASAERAKAAAQTKRFVRLEFLGSGTKKIVVDMCCKHEKPDFWADGTQGENDTVQLSLVPAYDLTSAKSFQVAVSNAVVTLP